jgi:hypothetical protein
MVIAATPAAAGTVRVAMVGAAVMVATAATAPPAIEDERVVGLGLRNVSAVAGVGWRITHLVAATPLSLSESQTRTY